jgi:hypothetical protein
MECPHDDVKSKYSERMRNLKELDDFLLGEIKVVLQQCYFKVLASVTSSHQLIGCVPQGGNLLRA